VPVISYLILFYHEGRVYGKYHLEEKLFVIYCIILGLSSYTNGIQISKYWRKMISNAKLNIDVQEVIQTCFELSKCFSENVFWSNPKPNIDRMISPSFQTEEEYWLNQQRLCLRQNNVDIDVIPLKEFVLYSLGIPLTTNVFKPLYQALIKKMKLTIQNFNEFQVLDYSERNLILERNSILACYFTQAKLELAKDGNEQLCVLMELFRSKGSTDIYMKSLPSNSVKKLTLMGKNSFMF